MLVVQKFGGTSVGSVDRIREVAKRCIATQREGHDVVVIVSAMSGETNRLLALAKQVNDDPPAEYERELDVIAATGEQVSVGLVALAIQKAGGRAQSFTRLAGAHHHRLGLHPRPHPVDRRPSASTRRWPRARSPSSPAFRACDDRRQHHDARSRRLRHERRRHRRRAQGRRLRDLHRRRRRLHRRSQHRARPRARSSASRTRKCWSWRRSAPRSCRSARSSSA